MSGISDVRFLQMEHSKLFGMKETMSHDPSPAEGSFTVSVYPEAAFTIAYSDSQATLLFCIEPVDNSVIYLNPHASSSGRIVDQQTRASEWYKTALARVAAYLGRQGAKVVLDE